MLPPKRPKHDDDEDEEAQDEEEGDESTDTETEIAQRQGQKSRKTLKRKRRATSPSRFGAALESLLSTTTTTTAPLSLRPEVARRQKEAKLERGAHKILEDERKEREEKGRVKDVIGEWGVEGERALRKVAQRGVITLFNAIQHAQEETAEGNTAAKTLKGTGKARLPAPDADRNEKRVKDRIDSNNFMEMIRAGAVVPKA